MGFLFTFTSAALKVYCDFFIGTDFGSGAQSLQMLIFILSVILTGTGIATSFIVCDKIIWKLFCLAVHILIWISVFLSTTAFMCILFSVVALIACDRFILKSRASQFIYRKLTDCSCDDNLHWPCAMHDISNNTYILDEKRIYSDSAVYIGKNTKEEITVLKSDVSGRTAKTSCGILRW